jgi:hypothetical protein
LFLQPRFQGRVSNFDVHGRFPALIVAGRGTKSRAVVETFARDPLDFAQGGLLRVPLRERSFAPPEERLRSG